MKRQHYYLVAGLPDIFFDDKKLTVSLQEFRSYVEEYLNEEEMEMIKLHFWQYDHKNIINRLENHTDTDGEPGNLSSENLDELFSAIKDDSLDSLGFYVPKYIGKYIDAYKNESPIIPGKSWELQLTELYYEYLIKNKNSFISNWYLFDLKLNNLLAAYNCRNSNLPIENQLIGSGELNDKLIKSSAKDFGLDTDDIPYAEQILKALDIHDLLEQEKKIDYIKWNLLSEESFFHYFSIEKIFEFLIKLSIAERWISLDKTKGLELFKELLNSLETSYEFPAEFSLK